MSWIEYVMNILKKSLLRRVLILLRESMMRCVIRLGDKTDHGGSVITGSSTMIIQGKGVARVGDKVSCPIKGHGVTTIIEGSPKMRDQGVDILYKNNFKCVTIKH